MKKPEQIIVKEIAGIQKYVLCEKSEINDTEKSIVGWGSRPTPDRDKELIEWKAWNLDRYKKNPVVLLSHKYDQLPIGKCIWIKNDSNGLKFKFIPSNTERGQEVYQLYKEGVLSAFSVGFTPREGGFIDNPTEKEYAGMGLKRVYKDVELLEISCVSVPANSDALVEFVKSGKVKNKQLKEELDQVIEIIDNPVKELEVETIVEKVEVTDNYVHVPAPGQEGKHGDHKIRTVTLSKKDGIMGKYCVDCKSMISYMFDKDKYSKDQAMKWVESHSKSIDENITKSEEAQTLLAEEANPEQDWSELVEEKENEPSTGDTHDSPSVSFKVPEEKPEVELKLDSEAFEKFTTIVTNLQKEIEELKKTKEPEVEKINSPEGLPSIYDITNAVARALSPDDYSAEVAVNPVGKTTYRYVVDLFPSQYPSGTVVYSERDEKGDNEYYRVSYSMDSEGEVTLNGTPEVVEQSWVIDRYNKDLDEEETITKIGMVLSGRNRKLIEDALTALQGILDAAAKSEEEEDFEIEDLETKELEPEEIELEDIEEKSDEPEDEDIEIDEEMLKGVLQKAVSDSIGSLNIKGTIEDSLKVLTGKVV